MEKKTGWTDGENAQETSGTAKITKEQQGEAKRFNKIYSNIASNRYENLRTSYIENKAKELRKKRKKEENN